MLQPYYSSISQIPIALFFYLGSKTILFYHKNDSFHSHFNHCGSADPQDSNLNQWLSSRKYAVEFTSGKVWTPNEILRNFQLSACTANQPAFWATFENMACLALGIWLHMLIFKFYPISHEKK